MLSELTIVLSKVAIESRVAGEGLPLDVHWGIPFHVQIYNIFSVIANFYGVKKALGVQAAKTP